MQQPKQMHTDEKTDHFKQGCHENSKVVPSIQLVVVLQDCQVQNMLVVDQSSLPLLGDAAVTGAMAQVTGTVA